MNLPTTLVARSGGRLVPWPNGLGTSREILVEERASPSGEPAFLWRLATTRIESDCPFSDLPGQDRTIMLLHGNGFELTHEPGRTQTLAARFGALDFAGDWRTRCRLLDGPVEVLNLLSSRDLARCAFKPMRLLPETDVERVLPDARAVYILEGSLAARSMDGATTLMEAGDTLHLRDGASAGVKLRSRGEPVHLLILEARAL